MSKTYEELLDEVKALQAAGDVSRRPSPEERADWAYGNTKIENADVTREMAVEAVAKKDAR